MRRRSGQRGAGAPSRGAASGPSPAGVAWTRLGRGAVAGQKAGSRGAACHARRWGTAASASPLVRVSGGGFAGAAARGYAGEGGIACAGAWTERAVWEGTACSAGGMETCHVEGTASSLVDCSALCLEKEIFVSWGTDFCGAADPREDFSWATPSCRTLSSLEVEHLSQTSCCHCRIPRELCSSSFFEQILCQESSCLHRQKKPVFWSHGRGSRHSPSQSPSCCQRGMDYAWVWGTGVSA